MKNTIILIYACLFFAYFPELFSQSKFQPGYIIDNNNDTIRGLIDYRNWERNTKIIRFKNKSDSDVSIYNLTEIQGYFINGEVYTKAIVSLDVSEYDDSKLSYTQTPQLRTDTVFLQILLRGEKNLFYYKTENLNHQFFIYVNSQFDLLIYKRYFKYVNGKKMIATNDYYKNQLYSYFNNCQPVLNKISKISYNKNNLVKLFEEYHYGRENEISYKFEPELLKSRIGVLCGISFTDIEFSGDDIFKSFINGSYPISKNITFGGFYDIVLPKRNNKWLICSELMYSRFSFNWEYNNTGTSSFAEITKNEIAYSYLKLNNLIRFEYPFKSMGVFVNGGISNGLVISETNNKEVDGPSYLIVEEAFKNSRTWEFGYVLGLGGNLKNYTFHFRYEIGNGMSSYVFLTSSVIRYSFILGYAF